MKSNQDNDQWLYGRHPVAAVLRQQPWRIRRLLVANELSAELATQAAAHNLLPEQVTRSELAVLLGAEAVHQGVAALCRPVSPSGEAELFELLANTNRDESSSMTLLLLDRVQDPRNLGACWRVADAAGCLGLVLTERQSAQPSAVAVKAASGALLPLFRVGNLVRVMEKLKKQDFWLYGADANADDSIYGNTSIHPHAAWVLGSEGRGLRPLVKRHCDVLLRIPMGGTVASLNLSVAAGLCLFETARRHQNVAL